MCMAGSDSQQAEQLSCVRLACARRSVCMLVINRLRAITLQALESPWLVSLQCRSQAPSIRVETLHQYEPDFSLPSPSDHDATIGAPLDAVAGSSVSRENLSAPRCHGSTPRVAVRQANSKAWAPVTEKISGSVFVKACCVALT
jgi:hypothetical protein